MLKMPVTCREDLLRAEKGGAEGHSLALSALVLLLTTVDCKDGCRVHRLQLSVFKILLGLPEKECRSPGF